MFKKGDIITRIVNGNSANPVTKGADYTALANSNGGGVLICDDAGKTQSYTSVYFKLKETSMNKAKEIKEAIEKLPICADGKKGVTALVEALGHKVEEKKHFTRGCIVRGVHSYYIIGAKEAICLNTGFYQLLPYPNFTYVAASLEEFLDNGGKL